MTELRCIDCRYRDADTGFCPVMAAIRDEDDKACRALERRAYSR